MRRHIFAAALLTGSMVSVPAQAQMDCSGDMASLAVAAVDSVISILGGGRASQLAQGLQIKEAVMANFCSAEINDSTKEIVEYERRNNTSGSADGIPGINGMIRTTAPWLDRAGFLTTETAIMDIYNTVYPDYFAPLTPYDYIQISEHMERKERASYLAAVALQNRAVQEQISALTRTKDHARAGRAGEGIRSELQAANAIGGEQVVATNALTAATVGSQRAMQENRLRDEAKIAAADATAEGYMSTLTMCGGCDIDRPFLRN